jgi:hypothetical protein
MSNITARAAHLTALPTWVIEQDLAHVQALIADRERTAAAAEVVTTAMRAELARLHEDAAANCRELATR